MKFVHAVHAFLSFGTFKRFMRFRGKESQAAHAACYVCQGVVSMWFNAELVEVSSHYVSPDGWSSKCLRSTTSIFSKVQEISSTP